MTPAPLSEIQASAAEGIERAESWFDDAARITMPHALFETRRPTSRVLVDTEAHPELAYIFGDGIRVVRAADGSMTVSSPDGEVSLPADCWAAIVGRMGL